jgi:hypothetical protein
MAVVREGLIAHNARTGRRGGICKGRSFDAVFWGSYEVSSGSLAKPTHSSACACSQPRK